MINLISNKLNLLLGLKRIFMLLCFVTISLLAHAGGSNFTYNYKVTVNQGTAPVGRGTVYLSATATVYDSDKSQWGDAQSKSNSVELDGLKELSIDCSQKREDNAPKTNPYIQFTSVTLKADPMAGSKFTGWTWSGGSSTSATISIADSNLEQCPNDRGDQSGTYTNSTAYTAQFIPRTYFYKTAGATVTAGGRVCMTIDGVRPDDASASWLESVPVGTTTESQNADENGKYARATIVRYYHALSPGAEYEFAGWYDSKCSELSKEIDFAYNLVATSENSNSPTTTSIQAVFVLKNNLTTITIDNAASTGLFTGTNIFKEGDATYGKYPYCKKRPIDVSAAFDESGNPLFDQLFVFGLTTNCNNLQVTVDGLTSHKITIPDASNNSNAVTPCYIYTKNGNGYSLSKTILNVNVATKPIDFNIAASGQKIYFTGYAPYASCGSTWEENGVFLFTNTVDVYLDNAQIYARPKSAEGNVATIKKYQVHSLSEAGDLAGKDEFDLDWGALISSSPKLKANIYTQGSGSVFCFQPKNGNITPSIHLKGENVLDSREGVYIHVDIDLYLTMKNQAVQMSAPIQILHNKNTASRTTTLTIDDIWDKSNPDLRTNGILDLAKADVRPAPTIDLGNENTTLNINGGQLFLSNSFNSSESYIVSYAISYRKKSFAMGDHGASIVGIGDDQPGGSVNFNDGTITCKPLTDDIVNSTLGQRLFHNKESMKCPKNTVINGGTFNCNVLSCAETESKGSSPKNMNGKLLCLVDIPVREMTTPEQLAVLYDDWMAYAKANDLSNTDNLSYYGIKSMKPTTIVEGEEEKLYVHLMLPSDLICFKEEISTPWVVCFPQTNVTSQGSGMAGDITIEVPGELEVIYAAQESDGLTRVYKTSRLFYGQVDDLLINSVSKGYTPPGDISEISFASNYGEIKNANAYAIYEKIYMLLPVIANEWKMFTPPFDVSNVYVIESYPEAELINDFGENTIDKKGNAIKKIISPEAIQNARYAQSHRMIDMFYQLITSLYVENKHADFWSNHGSYPAMGSLYSVSEYMQRWMNQYIVRDGNGNVLDESERPIIEQLYHYKSNNNGYPASMTRWDANFYLYKAEGAEWEINETGLQTNWAEVETISIPRNFAGNNNVIMNKGEVYMICFPYSVNNSDKHDFTKTWDYWTGKYILLEGYPTEMVDSDGDDLPDTMGQMISGNENDWNGISLYNTILSGYETSGKAVLRGNSTFSMQEINKDNLLVINGNGENEYNNNYDHNAFVHYTSATLAPAESFVLANAPASPSGMPRRIESVDPQSGEITYREETTTSLPTIGGNNHMFVYNIAGGVGIVPVVAQQVTIYNAAGQIVTSQYLAEETTVALPAGIYLIAGEKDQFKVVVK